MSGDRIEAELEREWDDVIWTMTPVNRCRGLDRHEEGESGA
jgi:hypothetical protein